MSAKTDMDKPMKCPVCGKFLKKSNLLIINDPTTNTITRDYWYNCNGCHKVIRIYDRKDREQKLF